MPQSLSTKLRLIREGVLLEAGDDKYDLPPNGGDDAKPSSTPTTTDDITDDNTADTDPVTPDDDSGSADPTDPPTDSDGTNYDIGANSGEDGGDTTGEEDPVDDEPAPPPPGELISLDATSRKLLAFKNFRMYRELRDSVGDLVTNLTDTPTMTDNNRRVIDLCLTQAGALLIKLDDYILYRYVTYSYEINYKNFMAFIVEKALIQKILDEMGKADV
jgi:hypothetical protein